VTTQTFVPLCAFVAYSSPGQTKVFSYSRNVRFAQWAFPDGAKLLLPLLLPFLNFTGKLQLPVGYEPGPALYKPKNGKRLPFLYIFRNQKARE
jgi:hypothetical protein